MKNIAKLLTELMEVPGLSGYEKQTRAVIEKSWGPLTSTLETGALGGLRGLKPGSGKQPRKSILIAAHMDAIGLMVREVKGEFLHFSAIGGIDPRVLPGQFVTVHGREHLPGLIAIPAVHTLPKEAREGTIGIGRLVVDTGLAAAKLAKTVRVGDLISFNTDPKKLDGNLLTGSALDNRASIAALTECLNLLQKRTQAWDVWAVASTREELPYGASAETEAFALKPDLAIAVDTTFAKGPGYSGYEAFELEGGPALAWGPSIHPKLFKSFEEIAEELEIPLQTEFLPGQTGTDADAMQISGSGVPALLLSIPIRYMHTPVEVVQLKDIQRTSQLLAAFISQLDEEFLDKLRWEISS